MNSLTHQPLRFNPVRFFIAAIICLAGVTGTHAFGDSGGVFFAPDPYKTVTLPAGGECQAETVRTQTLPSSYAWKRLGVSVAGQRLAYVVEREEGDVLVLDGQEHVRRNEKIDNMMFSEDGKLFVCQSAPPGISTTTAACVRCVCVNGEFGEYHPDINELTLLSTENAAVAYTTCKAERGTGQMMRVVLGDRADQEWNHWVGNMTVSPDRTRLAYRTDAGSTRMSETHLILDGRRHGPFGGLGKFCFSPDSRRFAAVVLMRQGRYKPKVHLWVDGQQQLLWEGLKHNKVRAQELLFSQNGARLGCVVGLTKKRCGVVIDGERIGEFENVSRLTFSPDGRHYAFVSKARKTRKETVYLDGKVHFDPDVVSSGKVDGNLVFSPDGSQLAFSYIRDGKLAVVSNGLAGSSYQRVRELTYGADNSLCYIASQKNADILVCGGSEILRAARADESRIYVNDAHDVMVYADCGQSEMIADQLPALFHVVPTLEHETFCFYDEGRKFAYVGTDASGGDLRVIVNNNEMLKLADGGAFRLFTTNGGACFQESDDGALLLAVGTLAGRRGEAVGEARWLRVPN